MKYDASELEVMFGDDPEIFAEIFQDFIDTEHELVGRVSDSIKVNSSDELQISAHTLKGVLATFCSTTAKDIAFDLEKMASSGNLEGAQQKCDALAKEVSELITELKDHKFTGVA